MARPKEDDPLPYGDNPDLMFYDADELESALNEIPRDDTTIRVFRIQEQGRSRFIRSYDPTEFSLDLLRQNHGGGKFKIVPKTRNAIGNPMRIEIEGKPIVNFDDAEPRQKDESGRWLTREEALEKRQKASVIESGGNSLGPILMMMMDEIRSLKSNLQNANPSQTRIDFYKEMALMKEIFTNGGDKTSIDANAITNLILKGLEIGKDAANGDLPNKSSVWEGILEKVIPLATQALTQAANRSPIPIKPNPILSNGSVVSPLPSTGIGDILQSMETEKKASTSNRFTAQLIPFIEPMMADAAAQRDPSLWAELIGQRVPESELPALLAWLEGDSWRNDLTALNPGIVLQAQWFEDLRNSLLEYITDPPEGNEHGATE